MEISQIEPRLEDTQDEYEKAQKFKEYVQGIFIENNSQDEFKRRVDAIFNETFKRERRWSTPFLRSPKTHFNLMEKWHLHSKT